MTSLRVKPIQHAHAAPTVRRTMLLWPRAAIALTLLAVGLPGWGKSPAQVIEQYPLASIQEGVRARAALDDSSEARRAYQFEIERRRYECHQQLTINRCLGLVEAERRLIESKLRAIEIQARKVIRQVRVVDRNASEASGSGAAGKAGSQPLEAIRSAPIISRTDSRLAEQRQRNAQRVAEMAKRSSTAAQESERRRQKQLELERKRVEHERKLARSRSNAAEYRERQLQAEQRRQEAAKAAEQRQAKRQER